MNQFLNTGNYEECCGCSACVAICPISCIKMKETEEGFLYPIIEDMSKCLHCSLCAKVCPMEASREEKNDITALAGYTKNDDVIMNCSSGGIFPEIAKLFLEQSGVVYGAHLQNDHKLTHIEINNFEELEKILGSKYIQSDMQDTFVRCKERLEEGKNVLFSGTPCQIDGLYRFLHHEYQNLYTIDVICHGVPSQKMFDHYVSFLERKHKAKLMDINFRDKSRNGWSITLKYTMESKNGRKKNYYLLSPLSEYFSGFLGGYFMRESCYYCPYASLNRPGDITLGDFWGYQKTRSDLKHDKGLSLLLINSDKGKELIEKLNKNHMFFDTISEESIRMSENKNLYKPTYRPECRNTIYLELCKDGFEVISQKYLRGNFTTRNRVKNMIPRKYLDKLRGIMK